MQQTIMTDVSPPPYAAAVQTPQCEHVNAPSFPPDLKEKHVVSEDDEEVEGGESPSQTAPSGGILLNRIRAKKNGSTVVDTSTRRILYHVENENRFLTYRGTLTSFHKGEDIAIEPYASIDNIAVTLAPLPGEDPSLSAKDDWKFLYHHQPLLGLP